MNMKRRFKRKCQDGAILITALLILLLLTLFGISTMDTNILEEKMAGNMRDRNSAFQSAESALRVAENWLAWLSTQTTTPDISNANIWAVKALDAALDTSNDIPWWKEVNPDNGLPIFKDQDWWDANAVTVSGDDELPDGTLASQPAYVIEKLPPSPTGLGAGESLEAADVYLQITARGVGGSPNTVVVLQSVYKW